MYIYIHIYIKLIMPREKLSKSQNIYKQAKH